jgi:hypothetical protein
MRRREVDLAGGGREEPEIAEGRGLLGPVADQRHDLACAHRQRDPEHRDVPGAKVRS